VRLGAGAADVFVTHAALHPRYQHHGGEITGLTRDVVRRLGIRQQWGSTLACLHETAVPTGQFAATVLRSREVAILPDYFQYGSGTAQRRRHGLLTHRSFGRDRFPGATVYLPERHREIARILYAPLGLERQIADPAQPKRVVTARPVSLARLVSSPRITPAIRSAPSDRAAVMEWQRPGLCVPRFVRSSVSGGGRTP
jgi:hypothetical protein